MSTLPRISSALQLGRSTIQRPSSGQFSIGPTETGQPRVPPAPITLPELEQRIERTRQALMGMAVNALGAAHASPPTRRWQRAALLQEADQFEASLMQDARRPAGSDLAGPSSLRQRLAQPACPSSLCAALAPIRVPLINYRSKRCPDCDKLLIKPEITSMKASFARRHTAR
jgi:hypothetical protein